jgi:hypothetical protein
VADTKISGLTAATSVDATDEVAINDTATAGVSGSSKRATAQMIKTFVNTAPLFAAGSATAASWPTWTAGTLLTTPEVGALELDANCLYATTDAGNRGVVPIRHIIRADVARTFTSNTTSQALFTSPTNGRITLETGTYIVEGMLILTGMSATTGNILLNLLGAGTATVAAWAWVGVGMDAAAATAAAAGGSGMITSSSPASIVLTATGTGLMLLVRGSFEVTAAGTMIPSMTMVTASASVLNIGSYLTFERIGSTTMVSVGQWD